MTSASVRAAVAGRLKGNYFTMRLDETRRVLESVPWVAQASVRRIWPDRLLVTLVEHRALGVWDDGRLLSDVGELFVANPAEAEIHGPLPAFEGPAAVARDAARRYYEFAAMLAPLGMRIAAIDVSDRRSWARRRDRRRWRGDAPRTRTRHRWHRPERPPGPGRRRLSDGRGPRRRGAAAASTRATPTGWLPCLLRKPDDENMRNETKDLIVGLDIGTSKVVVAVAEVLPEGRFQVIGLGQAESQGLRKGVVVNIESTVQSIRRALEEAELMAACQIKDVFTGIAGSHIKSFNSSGMVAIKDREVSGADVARVIETAKAVNIPTDQQVLHVLTQEFIVDGQEDIREPIGMSGVRLEVRVHIVTGAVSAAQNIIKCVRRCGLEVQDLILQPLASSLSVLSADEKELGVALVDVGGGTTDIAIFTGGAIRHTAILPIAGDQITNDIAMALRTPIPDAEEIKLRWGVAKEVLADPNEKIEIPGLGDRGPRLLSRQSLAAVIEPRVEELFTLTQQVIRESGYEELLSSGIVLTGGTSLLPGMTELAEDVFLKPARIGWPSYDGSLADVVRNPRFATAIGLLVEAHSQRLRGRKIAQQTGSFKQTLQADEGVGRGQFLVVGAEYSVASA